MCRSIVDLNQATFNSVLHQPRIWGIYIYIYTYIQYLQGIIALDETAAWQFVSSFVSASRRWGHLYWPVWSKWGQLERYPKRRGILYDILEEWNNAALVWSALLWSALLWSGLLWSGLVCFGLLWSGLVSGMPVCLSVCLSVCLCFVKFNCCDMRLMTVCALLSPRTKKLHSELWKTIKM